MITLFIVETDEGKIFAATKEEVDSEITYAENHDQDITFKVIGKANQPDSIDFPSSIVELYDRNKKDQHYIDASVIAITQYLL